MGGKFKERWKGGEERERHSSLPPSHLQQILRHKSFGQTYSTLLASAPTSALVLGRDLVPLTSS